MFPVRKLTLFALLNLADLGLTWYLLRAGGGAVYESNPVAAWWLGHYGWVGLAGFKAATMTLAAGLGVFIFFRRPATGNRVLAFACAALAAVVLYSGYLCHDLGRRPAGLDPAEATQLREAGEKIDARLQRAQTFHEVMAAVVEDVRGGRCALKEAVTRLSDTEQAQDETWMRRFQLFYPGRDDSECLARALVNHIDLELEGSPALPPLRRDIATQFLALYGHPLPPAANAHALGLGNGPAAPHHYTLAAPALSASNGVGPEGRRAGPAISETPGMVLR